MAPHVCTDDEMIVDTVITSTQRRTLAPLPSFGRDLVPYFVPGAATFNEKAVNVNTDVEALRRSGGSVLDIPPPVASGVRSEVSQQGKAMRASKSSSQLSPPPVVATKPKAKSGPIVKPRKTARSLFSVERYGSPINEAVQEGPSPLSETRSASSSPLKTEPWAGPGFVNSPPPSSLPVPGFVKPDASGGKPLSRVFDVVASEPSSPARHAVYSEFVPKDKLFVEHSLKRILQMA